jgi:hypothetical protein
LGLILVLIWFTHHVSVHWNVNLLHMSPLALVLPFFALREFRGVRPTGTAVEGMAGRLAALIAGGSVLAALVQLTPIFFQGDGEVLALALPVNLSIAWALTRFPAG